MKKVYSCRFIFIFLNCFACSLMLGSCSNESILSGTLKSQSVLTHKAGDTLPANSDNPYDSTGRIYDELFDAYYTSENLPQSLSSIMEKVESIASKNSDFTVIKSADYQAPSVERVQYIIALSHNNYCVPEISASAGLTAPAQLSLNSFITSLLLLCKEDEHCDTYYDFVVNYETSVLTNELFTERDKRIILTASSIARYSCYRAKKRPKKNTDPDWIIFVGNIVGSVDGAVNEKAEAITMALVTGIAQNQ